MRVRLQLQKFGAVTAGAMLLSAIAIVQTASAATVPPVTIGTVQGMFFTNPTPACSTHPCSPLRRLSLSNFQ